MLFMSLFDPLLDLQASHSCFGVKCGTWGAPEAEELQQALVRIRWQQTHPKSSPFLSPEMGSTSGCPGAIGAGDGWDKGHPLAPEAPGLGSERGSETGPAWTQPCSASSGEVPSLPRA